MKILVKNNRYINVQRKKGEEQLNEEVTNEGEKCYVFIIILSKFSFLMKINVWVRN